MTDFRKSFCRLMMLARKVNSGKATADEAMEYDYILMLIVSGVCLVGIVACIIISHVIKIQ